MLVLLLMTAVMQEASAQAGKITLSGQIKDKTSATPLPYVNVLIKWLPDSSFVTGTISNEEGRFTISGITPGNYLMECSYVGYSSHYERLFIGSLSTFLDLSVITMSPAGSTLVDVVVTAKSNEAAVQMDKKVIAVADNIAQAGGSVLQVLQNQPGVTIQDGRVLLRGNDKVAVLIDGKQTALTGFGTQASLDNIPASAIERIEIINNPSAKFDANGNAGIINIIYKKSRQEGFNGKAGVSAGLGALWVKQENLPGIRPQFTATPKMNPSLSLNYRKKKVNAFFQGDFFYNPTLNKNEFVTRTYDNGDVIRQQTKRNRRTTITTGRAGLDWTANLNNQFTIASLYSREKILDDGDEPFYSNDLTKLYRLWQFLEDEVKTTVTASATWQHKFAEAGHTLNAGYNYTFHREDERYFFTNTMPSFVGKDSFALISDEQVHDLTVDYVRPVRSGRIEAGIKYRLRNIPTNMKFQPGINSPLDTTAGGIAEYKEQIPALYGNYVFENPKLELEAGLRLEYVRVRYEVDPNHPTYKSDGYDYTEPFPNTRIAFKFNKDNKLSLFYNRRVDRPNEVDIRVFPKYDDAEIIKVGNPALKPQFTSLFELGYKHSFDVGYFFGALYHRAARGTITRIASTIPGDNLIYSIMQNAGKSHNTGIELMYSREVSSLFSFNLNLNGYYNSIDSFTVFNLYPEPNTFAAASQTLYSGSIKANVFFHFSRQLDLQLTAIYLAPDLIPQGKIGQRFSLDAGLKKQMQGGKGELFFNATDLLNTMVIRREINGKSFSYLSDDYYETQVIRIGYNYKF